MSQLFNNIKVFSNNRNTFDLSHNQVTSSDFGYLIPVCYRDLVPNDDFVVTPEAFCRIAPACAPFYGQIKVRFHHFFVPYRILYPQWDSFITQDPNNHTVPPFFTVSTLRSALASDPQYNGQPISILPRGVFGRLMSNLGVNPDLLLNTDGLDSSDKIAAFPFLAYYRIWLDYYMDSNLNDHPAMVAAFNSAIANGGSMAASTYLLYTRNCCFKKDYFTSAKLNPQDGNPSMVGVDLPTSVNSGGFPDNQSSGQNLRYINDSQHGPRVSATGDATDGNSKIGQFTVEALRAANSLQRYLERNNFVGTKLINRILAHFGIAPSAERLDMAEFLGGSSFPIRIGDVTAANSLAQMDTQGLGYKAGQGVGALRNVDPVRYHAKEHGIFMTLMSILPDTGYYQGLSRFWFKGVNGDALDYFTPEFENLGYQEILNKELYIPGSLDQYSSYSPDGVFGYTPRFSEYKFQQDILASDFTGVNYNSAVFGAAKDTFHLFRSLYYDDTDPIALNNNFVELDNHNTDYDRVFQETSNQYDHFSFFLRFDVKATRPMAGFGEPSLSVNNEGDGRTMNLPYGGTRL